ncbi:MAG: hypothetical protein E6H05_05825 [Bacillati bacterium ANGP1]|uniref:beta-N-acetylhexosaminidase n=1 Tax=Candidatus Segetimicrobium genomatis TaxID=2569760 RepID=A0A537IWP8_9BACT|nr:MAG: hypothetical protein E6H05_05825 [Terrabacteria group bacterium ANGP1]
MRLPVILLLLVLPAAAAAPAALGVAGGAVPDAFTAAPQSVALLPVPKQVQWGDGEFSITPATRIIVGDDAGADDLFAARELNEELRARYRTELDVVREREVADPAGHIVIGEPTSSALLGRLLEEAGISVTAASPGPEGYVLRVTRGQITVAGSDRRGTFYGVQTLRQLLRPAPATAGPQPGAVANVRVVTIRDRPDHAVRAVHLLLDGSSGEFHSALIDRILAPYKFNTLLVEAEDVQWESGRSLWSPDPRGATKAQVKKLLEVARQHHIQVIPLIPTLGHSEWVFAGLRDEALCAQVAYIPKHLREEGKPQVTCDRARGVYPAVYDPERTITINGTPTTLNEALIFPMLKEAIDLFRPAYVHLGHDEVRGPSGLRYDIDLYLRDIVTLSRFLRSSGVRPMVWGDVLWERRTEAAAEPLFRELPRDLVIVPWKYEDIREYPELSYFRRAGFPVLGATWYRLHNNYWFSRAAKAANALGMVRTTWTGHFQSQAALTRAYQQLYTYLSAAAYFWTSDRPEPDRAPREAELARRFAEAWKAGTQPAAPISGTLLDLSGAATQRHIDDDGAGWLGKGADYDLRALHTGRQRLGGVLFEVLDPRRHDGKSIVMLRGERDVAAAMPQRVTISWRGRAACLVFLHAALDRAVNFGDVIGQYRITLEGERHEMIDLRYGRDISSWLWDAERGIASIEQEVAWSGSTRAGNDVQLQMLRWTNPSPQTPIQSIELTSGGGRASPVVFAITALDRCP